MTAARSPRLYDLADEYQALDLALLESGGELTPEIEARLAALQEALPVKLDRIGALARELAARAEAAKCERDLFAEKARTAENSRRRLLEYAQRCMEAMGQEKLRGERFSFWLQENPPSVLIDAAAAEGMPDRFIVTRQEISKSALLEAWRSGEPLPPGVEVTREKGVRMR